MASKPDRFAPLIWLAATALSALGWWFGSGLQPVWWLTWMAPLPVLWFAPRVRTSWAALAAFVAFALGGLNQWVYLHEAIRLPMPIVVYAIGMPAIALTLCVLLYRRLLLRGHTLAAALAMPTAWVAIEYINNLLSPHGTFGSIGYTQMNALPVIQVAAVAGIWGIGFLVMLLPAAIAAQVAPQATKPGRLWATSITALAIAASIAYGSWRLQAAAETTMRIGLVSLDKPVRPALADADGQALEARYVEAIHRLASQGAKVILIPETSFSTASATIPAFADVANQRGLVVGAGIDFKGNPHAERNTLTVFQSGASSPTVYYKRHLIPGFEDQYTPGDSYALLAGRPLIGLAVCKDMDFHDIGQVYGVRRVQLLLVPAWDFSLDGWLHSRMAIMRGVESGFAIARTARSGRLALSDDRGRVVAEASSEDKQDAELVGDLPLRDTRTLYTRWGDWFAWLDLVAFGACLVLAFLPRRTSRT